VDEPCRACRERLKKRAEFDKASAMKSRQILAVLALVAVIGPAAAQSDPQLPYWASISVDEARMRKGPSPDVPVIWEYRRRDLPVKVIARHELWRKIEDPGAAAQPHAHGDRHRRNPPDARIAERIRARRLSCRSRRRRPDQRLPRRLVPLRRQGPSRLDRNRPYLGRLIFRARAVDRGRH
jgi:hypothetical protein